MGQPGNKKKKLKSTWNKWKWKNNGSNLWDAAKAILRGKFIATQAYFRKQEKSQINKLNLNLKELEKEQTKHKTSRGKEIIKIKAEINNIEIKNKTKPKKQINDTWSWLFEKLSKIDKLLAKLNKKKRERTQKNKITMREEK